MIYIIRKTVTEDLGFLREMLYLSIHIPQGEERPQLTIIDTPQFLKYTGGWMKETDCGFIAESNGNCFGAAWSRLFKDAASGGYGFLDPSTPELAFAVHADYRDQGIGTALMEQLFDELKKQGYKKLSLSVDRRNRAVNLYKRLGFKIVKKQKTDYLMLKQL